MLSGEDDELSAAYKRFRKMIDQEHSIVGNATLEVVDKAQTESAKIRTDVQENLALAGRTDLNIQSLLATTEHVRKVLDGTFCSTRTPSKSHKAHFLLYRPMCQ
jgi:hypothetical protein